MELREALTQITEIRQQMARSGVFRGYRSATVGFSGVLGLLAAAFERRRWGCASVSGTQWMSPCGPATAAVEEGLAEYAGKGKGRSRYSGRRAARRTAAS
jgi:hypothetical protein